MRTTENELERVTPRPRGQRPARPTGITCAALLAAALLAPALSPAPVAAQAVPDQCAVDPTACLPAQPSTPDTTPAPGPIAPAASGPATTRLFSGSPDVANRALTEVLGRNDREACDALRRLLDERPTSTLHHGLITRTLREGKAACVGTAAESALFYPRHNADAQRALVRLRKPKDLELLMLDALDQRQDAAILARAVAPTLSPKVRTILGRKLTTRDADKRLVVARALEQVTDAHSLTTMIVQAPKLHRRSACATRAALLKLPALTTAAKAPRDQVRDTQLMRFAHQHAMDRRCRAARHAAVTLLATRLAEGPPADQRAWLLLLRPLQTHRDAGTRIAAAAPIRRRGACFPATPGGDPPAMHGVMQAIRHPVCGTSSPVVQKRRRRQRRRRHHAPVRRHGFAPTFGVSLGLSLSSSLDTGDHDTQLTVPVWFGVNYYPRLGRGMNAFVTAGAYLDFHEVDDDVWMDFIPTSRIGISFADKPHRDATDRYFPYASVYALAGYRISNSRPDGIRAGVGFSSAWLSAMTLYLAASNVPLPVPGIVEWVMDYKPLTGETTGILLLGLGF